MPRQAYELRGASKVPEASVNGIFISLWTLAYLDLAAPEARPIKQIFDGMGSVLRFVLDHPLDQLKPFGMTTSSFCAVSFTDRSLTVSLL